MENEEIRNLQEAVKINPDNIPLRKHLAGMLLKFGRYEEAEVEYKAALKIQNNNLDLKLGLASSFYHQEKTSAGLVLIEDIIQLKEKDIPASAFLLYSKLLLQNKQPRQAKQAYDTAVIREHKLTDKELEAQINEKMHSDRKSEPIKQTVEDAETHFVIDDVEIERPKITFHEVGGMQDIKEEIKLKIIHPLEHPEIYKAYGKPIGGGILMYGPPGCGKTHLAKATAGEVNANFVNVGINDILDMYMGESERKLHSIFEKARAMKPCVLFFDEVDALGASRTDMKQSSGRKLINQFLAELDGVEYTNEGVLILAATNAPWHLDSAFRRPGRFDRILFIPPPDEIARTAILRIMLKDKPTDGIDYELIAKKAKDYSGADIKALVDIAIERKLNDSIKKGVPLPLKNSDFQSAIKSHKPTTKEWFGTAKNYALFANEGGLYDTVLEFLNIKKKN